MTTDGNEAESLRFLGNELKDFLRGVRLLSGQSQADVGAFFGVRQQTIGSWEMGHTIPQRRHMAQIIETFGLSDEEARSLRLGEGAIAWASRMRPESETIAADRARVIGALVTRIETGDPPLTDPEATLLARLLEANGPADDSVDRGVSDTV